MLTIQRPSNRILTFPPVLDVRSAGGGEVAWSTWFDHFWMAKGAASYAASLLDLVGAQNLTEGNGAVPWAAGTGWGFIAASAQWLDTVLSPPIAAVTWSIMVQYANALQADRYLCGARTAPYRMLNIIPYTSGDANKVFYGNGVDANYVWQAPQLASGNLAIAAKVGYRNGAADAVIPAGVPTGTSNIFIGAYNAVPINAITADIYAVGIKEATLTAPQIAAAAAAMALL